MSRRDERLDQIPPPEEVKRRLSANYREAHLLRQLLRISKRKAEMEKSAREEEVVR